VAQLWGGLFSGQTDQLMVRFNESLPFDWLLWDADITGSVAWLGDSNRGLLTKMNWLKSSLGWRIFIRDCGSPEAAFTGAREGHPQLWSAG
jgi:argininosuccinate lyase